jgi:hypothetical protein
MCWSTTVCTCRRDLENFPSSAWETHVWLGFLAGRRYQGLWHCHVNVFLNLREYSWLRARSSSKVSHHPDGKIADSLPRFSLAQLRLTLRSTTVGTCRRVPKIPHRSVCRLTFARCWQGGGVFVGGGTVAISSCTISGNTAGTVRAHLQKFPSPRLEIC